MTTTAAIDIGSNSVHLLIAGIAVDGALETRVDESTQLGLGIIVERQGRLGAAARRDACDVVARYAAHAADAGATWVLLMGTQPLRRASDRSLLRRDIRDATGLELTVLSHEQEAALTLLGVTDGRALDAPLAVIDVGGGSTEVILVEPDADPVVGAFPVGSARLTSAVVQHDPPTAAEVTELRREAGALASSLPTGSPARGIVSGGSGTNVSRLLGRERTMPVDRDALDAGLRLLQQRPAAAIALETGLTERRVRQLAAGIVLVGALMERYGLRVTDVSDAGLREGAVLAAAAAGADWLAGSTELMTGQHTGRAENPSDGA